MTAVTILDRTEGLNPTCETVVITGDDTNTYISRKFAKIRAISATPNYASGAELEVSFSGGQATLSWSGITSGTATLVIYGRK